MSPSDGDLSRPTEDEVEQLLTALRRHLAEGRLTLEEFDSRAALLYAGTTRASSRQALADLPLLDAQVPVKRKWFRKRHGEGERLASHWVATDEVFRNPTTSRVMRVWLDPIDGSRHYAEDAD